MHVYCDFDGTISVEDATDFVLSNLADPAWEAIEQQWQDGEIGSAECMRRQIGLIHAKQHELDDVLEDVVIDPTFSAFADFCSFHALPLTIVSDGVDYFIKQILVRNNLSHIPVVANKLTIVNPDGKPSYHLTFPHADPDCLSVAGVCKCRSLTPRDLRVYIGDGRSDFCVSHQPELVFAKGKLADYCFAEDIPFIAYETFADLTHSLKSAIPSLKGDALISPRHVAA